jgi:hypothetical protein
MLLLAVKLKVALAWKQELVRDPCSTLTDGRGGDLAAVIFPYTRGLVGYRGYRRSYCTLPLDTSLKVTPV